MSKRRGRPPLDPTDPSTKITVALPKRAYDATDRVAKHTNESMAAVIRRGLEKLLDETGRPR